MRYIGNKTRILESIEELIKDKELDQIENATFGDLFSGTGSVAEFFKDKFNIIINDSQYNASVISEARINNPETPEFKKFLTEFGESPFTYFNDKNNIPVNYTGFVSENFTPNGDRKFFTVDNAIVIDFIRNKLDELRSNDILDDNEYIFLLGSLLESSMGVSNTSGTYEAFFEDWEARAKKVFKLEPITLSNKEVYSKNNRVYNEDTNELVRKISGDIAYIDPPYTVTQYASAYHVLETIALNDSPEIRGKTGRRVNRRMSDYNKKTKVKDVFEDLIRQVNFEHIIISYSNQGLVPIEELIDTIKKYAIENTVDIRYVNYREYRNLNSSQKSKGNPLQEFLIYFKKDTKIKKSPLNYAGSKNDIIDIIKTNLPSKISTFVDSMAGAYNVGINIDGADKIIFNEKQPFVHYIMQSLLYKDGYQIINSIENIINEFSLSPGDKESYLQLRQSYNDDINKDYAKLYVLSLYSFQHMIRFNQKGGYNVPVGNSGFNENVVERILNFTPKTKKFDCWNKSFEEINYFDFDKDSLFYFDPPYIITSAAYNDGNRMNVQWTPKMETLLLNKLSEIHEKGYKFMLSNVIEHKGETNKKLIDWIKKHNFNVVEVGKTGRRFPRHEVLVKNY